MLSHWKKWIADRVGRRTPPRCRVAPRFRGQFESLETRNVLSATIGVLSLDVVAVRIEPTSVTIIAVADFEPAPRPLHEFHALGAFAAGDYFEPLALPEFDFGGFAKFVGGPGESGALQTLRASHQEAPPSKLFGDRLTAFNGPLPRQIAVGQQLVHGALSDIKGNLNESYWDNFENPSRSAGNDMNAGASEPLKATDPGGDSGPVQNSDGRTTTGFLGGLSFSNRTLPFRSSSGGAYLVSTFNVAPASTDLDALDRVSLKSQDAAFESLSSGSLLLAVNGDLDEDSELLGGPKDKLDLLDESGDQEEDSAERSVADNLAESLDVLQRERAAVDTVLAELHDIRLTDKSGDSTTTQSHRDQSEADLRDFAERFFIARSTDATQSPYDASAGGMVLLAATGDANSSAYDLAPATATGLEEDNIALLAVEAPVGLYQAIDVGVRPTQSTTVDNISTTQPEMKVRTNVSAENAPAKKSEQPAA